MIGKAERNRRAREEAKKARETPFNGWTNIGTWRVALLLGNDQSAYSWVMLRIFQIANAGYEGGRLVNKLAETLCYRVRRDDVPFDKEDGQLMREELRLALREGGINWREIAKSFIDEDERFDDEPSIPAKADAPFEPWTGEEMRKRATGQSDNDEPSITRIVMPEPRDPMDDSEDGNDAMDAYYDRLVD